MLDFIRVNWKLIVIVILVLVNLIVLCFKKTKVVTQDNVWTFIMSILPSLITKVEVPGNGEEKLTEVICYIFSMLKEKFGLTDDEARVYVEPTKDYIEKILSCPQKKGKTYETKNLEEEE